MAKGLACAGLEPLLGVTILAGVGKAVVKLIGAQEERRGLWIQKAGGSWGTEVSRPGKD